MFDIDMYYLRNFLFVFSLRFGSQLTAYIEIVVYGYSIYYMVTEYGNKHTIPYALNLNIYSLVTIFQASPS